VTTLHVILPGNIDDPMSPSGGNRYDRRVCDELAVLGWSVRELPVRGTWPRPSAASEQALADVLAKIPDGDVVLLDGLIACAAPDSVLPAATRLRLVVLVHSPLGSEAGWGGDLDLRERATLHAVAAVVVTSAAAAFRLNEHHDLPLERLYVAEPGVDPANLTQSASDGTRLLVVAAVTPAKGHDVLVEALAEVADLHWSCSCVGTLDRDPAFASTVRTHRLGNRLRFAGPRTGAALDASYAAADLLLVASRTETYGMAVTEALARGIPVVATDVGGLPEALGQAPDGAVPGLLVPPGDPAAFAGALRRWLTEPGLRDFLRCAAADRRRSLPHWRATALQLGTVLAAGA